MTTVSVYESGFLKHGPAITNATFAQVYYDPSERDVGLASERGQYPGVYYISLLSASGDVRVSAMGYRQKKVSMMNGGQYEVWLDKA